MSQSFAPLIEVTIGTEDGWMKEGGLLFVKIGGSRLPRMQDVAQFVDLLGTNHETHHKSARGN